jgi:hypothetical protein
MRWSRMLAVALCLILPAGAAPRYGEAQVAALLEIAQAEREPEARRAQAIRALAQTEVRTHLGVLRRLLREERSLDIRLSAAVTLAALGDRSAPRDLLLATAYDGSRTPNCTRSDVLLALARTGDPTAELHLARALQSEAPADEPQLHAEACRALGILNTPGARKLLLSSLRDGTPEIRRATVPPLSTMAKTAPAPDREAARKALVRAAQADPDESVAEPAAGALLWNGVDGPAFFALLEHGREPAVRARAARVMNRHYLSPARLQRLRAALARERDPGVRQTMQETLAGQHPPR